MRTPCIHLVQLYKRQNINLHGHKKLEQAMPRVASSEAPVTSPVLNSRDTENQSPEKQSSSAVVSVISHCHAGCSQPLFVSFFLKGHSFAEELSL